MTLKRVVLLSLVLVAFASSASAMCEDCLYLQCIIITPSGSSLVEGLACSAQTGYGTRDAKRNCRTVSGCQGCIGWSCAQQDPLDVELRVVSVTIEPEKPQTDAPAAAR